MIDTPDDLLLLEAEHLARDLLLDAEDTRGAVAGLLAGWASVIRAADGYYAPMSVTPCSQVWEIGQGMRRDALDWIGKGSADPRLRRIQELFEAAASAPGATRSDPRSRTRSCRPAT